MGSFSIWHWLILFGIVWLLWRIFRRGTRDTAPSRPVDRPATHPAPGDSIAKIRGNGRYEVDVVGESFYAASFAELARRHHPEHNDDESFGDAVLTLEEGNPHDKNAVAVHIEGLQVGYLSRAMAADFRKAIRRDGLQKHRQFAVSARLYWGGAEELQSVTIDLPQA
jgi:hypothetical protein